MKKLALLFFLTLSVFSGAWVFGQSGIITTIAGTGSSVFSGDGGPATAAGITPEFIIFDNIGNLIFTDRSNRIRKIDTFGVISTIAGTGVPGYSGDGGPATAANIGVGGITIDAIGNIYFTGFNRVRKIDTSGIVSTIAGFDSSGIGGDGGPATAAHLNSPRGLAYDASGNLYIADFYNSRIRKINTSGIISTFAGTSYPTGIPPIDGSPATLANLSLPSGVKVDLWGNVYFIDGNYNIVRKVNTSGQIYKIAGNGGVSIIGEGGPATAAFLYNVWDVATDGYGNVYECELGSFVVRRINTDGIIHCYAGSFSAGFSGDGMAGFNAKLSFPRGIAVHGADLYIADANNYRIRKVAPVPAITSDSMSVYCENSCDGIQFQIYTHAFNPAQHIITFFGDGTSIDFPVTAFGSMGLLTLDNIYNFSGSYTIKHVLYDSTLAVDSVIYSHTATLCQNISVAFYYNSSGSCDYNSTLDSLNILPLLIEIDSNGSPIDTISSTSGFHYTAYGSPGDVYAFKVIEHSASLVVSCPSSGIIYDTLSSGFSSTKYIGLNCSGASGFDLEVHSNIHSGPAMQHVFINLDNAYCNPETTSFTFQMDTKYDYVYSYPSPSTLVGNIATWNLGDISLINSPKNINMSLSASSSWLLPGDTVKSSGLLLPTISDLDTLNNYFSRIDTVKSSYDPNEMTVSRRGCIASTVATNLEYTVQFENTGNDTAHNIYVMDTLSDNVDQHSLRIVAATNRMNVSKWYDPTYHNIFKFEFPGINLLDSSHHNQCDGMFIYTINTKPGLPDGSTIFAHAGIFFDDNPVVMTNYTENITGCLLKVANTSNPGNKVTLYPNPATNTLTISNTEPITTIHITDIVGQTVLQTQPNAASTKIDVSGLQAGIYFVKVNGSEVRKFVKQ